jgi:hypothetical protein
MRVKSMWVRSSADTIKFIFRKAVRAFERLARLAAAFGLPG